MAERRGTAVRRPTSSPSTDVRTAPRFPVGWPEFFDVDAAALVKQRYSPRPAWRPRPFTARDEAFFFRGVRELSDLFTCERGAGTSASPPRMDYFNHARFRSAYLLYFLPLQAAKFAALFDGCPAAMEAMLDHARGQGVLRVADLGSGPGTASLALLLWLADMQSHRPGRLPERIELQWYDLNRDILTDGEALLQRLLERLAVRGWKTPVDLRAHRAPWQRWTEDTGDVASITLMGNVLNEDATPTAVRLERAAPQWRALQRHAHGAGVLILEPASRDVAQHLSALRAALLEDADEAHGFPLHGPCLHTGRCPLGSGRDWCHFSLPIAAPGRLLRGLSSRLGSVRTWLKFSWLWLAAVDRPAAAPAPDVRRVVSDALHPVTREVLLCEPGRPSRHQPQPGERLGRGDLVRVASSLAQHTGTVIRSRPSRGRQTRANTP